MSGRDILAVIGAIWLICIGACILGALVLTVIARRRGNAFRDESQGA